MAEREELLASVNARLERVAATQDLEPVLEPGALDEAHRLVAILHDDDGDLDARYLLGWLHWFRYEGLPEGEDSSELAAAVVMLTPCFIAGVEELPPPLRPLLAGQAVQAASEMLEKAGNPADEAMLFAAATLWQRIVDAIPLDHPERAGLLSLQGAVLQAKAERTGILADHDAAIEAIRVAAETTPPRHFNRAWRFSNLWKALQARFEQTGEPADLDAMIEAARVAAETTPAGHADRTPRLANLGASLYARFGLTRELADLDAAINAARAATEAAAAADDPHRPLMLSNLASALRTRFGHTGDLSDLDAAIEARLALVGAVSPGNPDRAEMLSDLAIDHFTKFKLSGTEADLDAAIAADEAAAAAVPVGHPQQPIYLANLSEGLYSRFEQTGVQAELDAAIAAGQAAVAAAAADTPHRAQFISNLGKDLLTRFDLTGELADLEVAVEAGQTAVTATPVGHPDRAGCLSGLGNSLQSRFARTGASADLDAAVVAFQAAVGATAPDDPDLPGWLSNVAAALNIRFRRTGALADLDAAAKAIQAAVNATPPGHPDYPLYKSNLSGTLGARYQRTGSQADLDAAVEAAQAAVNATPRGHPSRGMYLSNLGIALHAKFERTGARADLDAAIMALEAAVAATPADHADRSIYLTNLGINLQNRYERFREQADWEAAESAYSQAAEDRSGSPSVRIQAARAAGRLVAHTEPGRAASLLEAAVRLLPQVAPRQLERSDQHYTIGRLAGLASEATALVLADTASSERESRALRLLEAGRAVLLSQALDIRNDLTDLRDKHPDLAARFTELRNYLERPSDAFTPLTPRRDGTGAGQAWSARIERDRRRLADELDLLLDQIRALEGFASFGLPPAIGELMNQAMEGPVVTINVSTQRSDALVLTTTGIMPIRLPRLTLDVLIDQVVSFYQALSAVASADAGRAERITAQRTLAEVLAWLWDVAAEPVLGALGYQRTPPPGTQWPRLWWVPGGLLGMLPIHAAGHLYHLNEVHDSCNVMDRVISSYTPTIRALRHARRPARSTVSSGPAVVVAMPVTPGLAHGKPLPYASAEAARIRPLIPSPRLLSGPMHGEQESRRDPSTRPTRDNVLKCLSVCSIAHFACHGVSHPSDPSKSQLLLEDHSTAPLTVASLAPMHYDHIELVYLSACRTALTEKIPDEGVHLASAFQLAGARQVIGTLWDVNDAIAADVAATFYSSLRTEDANLDTGHAAAALHHAVRSVRDAYPHTPSLWAGYLHVGA